MRCEVCGRKILGEPLRAVIEGAQMVVCGSCAKFGTVYLEPTPLPKLPKRKTTKHPVPKVSAKKPIIPKVIETFELVDNFGLQVRQAREKLGFSHEDLGRKISEKVSVLRKIETGKMTPDHHLAEKLEHTLRIKLLLPPSEPKIPPSTLLKPPEITLEKVAHLKKRKTETAKD